MTQSGYSKAIVNAMLGWLKGLASWVLRLFNLSGGASPLKFLANNWLRLLVILLIVGMAADLVIWLIRWRPHWVWFHRKRVIINDKDFFAGENDLDEAAADRRSAPVRHGGRNAGNWRDDDYVVASAAHRRRAERERREMEAQRVAGMRTESRDVFRDGSFDVNAEQESSDRYEDEVFSVSSLPGQAKEVAEVRPKFSRTVEERGRVPSARGARGVRSAAPRRSGRTGGNKR